MARRRGKRGRALADTSTNPFGTASGHAPAVLAGRDAEIAQFREVLTQGPKHRHYLAYLIGPRGYGKTVMLGEIASQAKKAQWLTYSLDAAGDVKYGGDLYRRFHEQLVDTVNQLAGTSSHIRNWKASASLTAGMSPSASIAVEVDGSGPGVASSMNNAPPVRKCLELLADETAERETGILITIDEIHDADPAAIRRIGNDIQLIQVDDPDRWVCFVGAGLPDTAEPGGLLEQVSTFLQRGRRISVGALSDDEARASLAGGYAQADLTVTEEVLESSVSAASGHPWYLQLVGHHTVGEARRAQVSHVDAAISDVALTRAHLEAGPMLFAPVWGRLSQNDRALLTVIAAAGTSCPVAQARKHLGWSSQLLHKYRCRLQDRALLQPSAPDDLVLTHQHVPMWLEQQWRQPLAQVLEGDGDPDLEERTAAAVGSRQQEAQFNLVNAQSSARPAPRCGTYGPRSQAPCVLPRGHKGQHRYR